MTPDTRMWKRFLVLLPLTLVLAFGSFLYIRHVGGTYTGTLYEPEGPIESYDIKMSDEGVVEVVSIEQSDEGEDLYHVTFRALANGTVQVGYKNQYDVFPLYVQDGVIICDGIDFTGWRVVFGSVVVLLAAVVVLCGTASWTLIKRAWFGYEMIACCGLFLFMSVQLVSLLGVFFGGTLQSFSDMAYYDIVDATGRFVGLSLLPMALAAVVVSLSNIELIRYEGLRPVNLLGILAGLAWIAATAFYEFGISAIIGMHEHFVLYLIVDMCVGVAITFAESLLISTIVCAWLAARHKPTRDCDYVVILGCGLRADGSPTPLLQGRVDRAIAFDAERVARGEKPVTYVPSGGKGSDEIWSEAEGMARYLAQQGVEPERILKEDRSVRTSENMIFSRAIIERHSGKPVGESHVSFSTTNYHVFRGYVCAHQAGMEVEGMASPTRRYFWPNAFLREFVGLLVDQRQLVINTYGVVAFVYTALELWLVLR